MDNNVVVAIAMSLQARGLAALTFNFRGVGSSQGSYDSGAGEQDDVLAAIDFAGTLDAVRQVALAGYSFGARMAASVAGESVPALAFIALPTSRPQYVANLKAYEGPLLYSPATRTTSPPSKPSTPSPGNGQCPPRSSPYPASITSGGDRRTRCDRR